MSCANLCSGKPKDLVKIGVAEPINLSPHRSSNSPSSNLQILQK